MTVEGDDDASFNLPVKGSPNSKLSKSQKGLFSSLRERGDEVTSTPEGSSKGKPGGFLSSPIRSEGSSKGKSGVFFSSPGRSPVPLSPVSNLLNVNVNPLKNNLSKILTPSRTFSRLRDEREEVSRQTPTPSTSSCFKDRIKLPLLGEVRFDHAVSVAKAWLRNPKNLAVLFWGIAVGISGALLFMVMVGMLDAAIPTKADRDTLYEVSNQIINALFTLMAVYLHPQRCLHLHLLYRWHASDILKLREVYCKNGTRKPHEWAHMLVVVLLLQLNCFAQYALCGLNWGYRRAQRPAIGVGICLCLSLGAAAGANIYNTLSPLGKDFELETDGSEDVEKDVNAPETRRKFSARTKLYKMLERKVSFAYRDEEIPVTDPEWKGGLFDCASDPPVSVLSMFCCPCVFGWNMDRLGFGNRYVHIITFVLLLTAPFWIFDLAAINIDNKDVRHGIAYSGIILCAFGLLYGGFWRIRMRERFNLPQSTLCCRHKNVADCSSWFFCPLCSLCQEVRTAEAYEVLDDKFYARGPAGPGSPPIPTASPPTEFASIPCGPFSPRTPATTLPAVQEMPPTAAKRDPGEVELVVAPSNPFSSPMPSTAVPMSTNPFLPPEGLSIDDNYLDPPLPLLATRDSSTQLHAFPASERPSVVASPPVSTNPFLPPERTSSNNPFATPAPASREPAIRAQAMGGASPDFTRVNGGPSNGFSHPTDAVEFTNPGFAMKPKSPIHPVYTAEEETPMDIGQE